MSSSCSESLVRLAVPCFNRLDTIHKRLFQNALANGPEYEAEHPSLEVLALPNDDHINIGGAIRTTREGVVVTRGASPHVGVCRRQHHMPRIGPVVVQPLPD